MVTETTSIEQLRLPEQLYLLLINPNTGAPRFARERVKRVLAISVLWELLYEGVLSARDNTVLEVKSVPSSAGYLYLAGVITRKVAPIPARDLTLQFAAEMHPLWETIGEAMVHEHLLAEEVRTRFLFFHQRVLTELTDARRDGAELTQSLRQVARSIWNEQYDDELARTHPRLLARFVLLDNCRLLAPLIGVELYGQTRSHITSLRNHLRTMIADKVPAMAEPVRPVATLSDSGEASAATFIDTGWEGAGVAVYFGGIDFWVDGSGDSQDSSAGGDFDDGQGDGDSSSGGDSGGDGGGGGGD